jgi:1,4-dihydroxy-2-naphthoyl-CoA hydrolase
MNIWFKDFPLDAANARAAGSLIGHLGIELVTAGDDYLEARMPVDTRTVQPAGVLHGGASVALAETLASWGATLVVDPDKHYCVGQEINANHIRGIREGHVTGVARPVHLGRRTQVWEVRITDDAGRLVCISRVTVAVLDGANPYL